MNIRAIEEKDINAVSHLILRNFDEVMINCHSPNIIEKFKYHNKPEDIRNQMKWKEIFVVEKNNEVIATGALANFGDSAMPKYCISNFFVKPELHKQGIGSLLFNYILQVAKDKQVNYLHVPSSRNGFKFYEKMGFVTNNNQNDKSDEITWMIMKIIDKK